MKVNSAKNLLVIVVMLGSLLTFLNELFYLVLRNLPFIRKPKSKNYLIVGASSGIGRELVFQIAKKSSGEIGIAIASRKGEELADLKKDVEKRFSKVKVFVRKFDITHFNDVDSLLDDTSKALGGIDTIVVNAGIFDTHALGEDDYFKKAKAILDTNLTGPVALISGFVRYAKKMKILNPYIVTVSSIASAKPEAYFTAYGTSKRGLDFFIKGVHDELYFDGFWTTNIRPGVVATKMIEWTDAFQFPTSPRTIAKTIAHAMERRTTNLVTPFFWNFIIFAKQFIPTIFSRARIEKDQSKYLEFQKHTYSIDQ